MFNLEVVAISRIENKDVICFLDMLVLRKRMPYRLVCSRRHAINACYPLIVAINDALCNPVDFSFFAHVFVVLLHKRLFFFLFLAVKIVGYPRRAINRDAHFIEIFHQVLGILVLALIIETYHSIEIVTSHYERLSS